MPASAEPPLCVDLDGTLIDGDTLLISVALLARRYPWLLPVLPFALLQGRPGFKRFLASRVLPEPDGLPWRSDVVAFVRAQRATGRRIYLTTAADIGIAESVMRYLGCFDGVLATELGANRKAEGKLAAIRNLLGDNEFDYIGDSTADLPVFRAARGSYLVAPSTRLEGIVRRAARVQGVFAKR